jgi:hypothetical protein
MAGTLCISYISYIPSISRVSRLFRASPTFCITCPFRVPLILLMEYNPQKKVSKRVFDFGKLDVYYQILGADVQLSAILCR